MAAHALDRRLIGRQQRKAEALGQRHVDGVVERDPVRPGDGGALVKQVPVERLDPELELLEQLSPLLVCVKSVIECAAEIVLVCLTGTLTRA